MSFPFLCCLQVDANIKRRLIIKQIISFSLKPATGWLTAEDRAEGWKRGKKFRFKSFPASPWSILLLCIKNSCSFSRAPTPGVIRLVSRCRRSKLENFLTFISCSSALCYSVWRKVRRDFTSDADAAIDGPCSQRERAFVLCKKLYCAALIARCYLPFFYWLKQTFDSRRICSNLQKVSNEKKNFQML
jgi:hypothetical protein